MINPEDEVYFDMRSSCTNHEAVIKMMGGMQGSIRKHLVNLGDPFAQLEQVVKLNGSLETFFNELRETTRLEFLDALDAGVETSVFLDKAYAVKRIDTLFEDFMDYLMAIDDEVAKGNESVLRIDRFTTEKSGTVHISLNSLRRWARAKFEISIEGIEFGVQPSADSSNEKLPESGVNVDAQAGRQPRRKMLDQEKAILEAINSLRLDPLALPFRAPGTSGTKAAIRGLFPIKTAPFEAITAFDRAWERLLNRSEIVETKAPSPL